jgi:hypothetical protein
MYTTSLVFVSPHTSHNSGCYVVYASQVEN